MFTRYLRYLWYRSKFPKRLDFLDMGFGIEARYERCRRFWKPHLDCCKSIQAKVFSAAPGCSELFVLGAGRLLDLNCVAALENFKSLHLIDADPACASIWSSTFKALHAEDRVKTEILDLSASIDAWSDALESLCRGPRSVDKLIELLNRLALQATPALRLSATEGAALILSLNLLSQIPIYFRERVEKILLKRWKLDSDSDGKYEPALQAAIDSCMAKLEEQHLTLLAESGAQRILLISDAYFHYYLKDRAPWRTERALTAPEYDENGPVFILPGYIQRERQSWLWHIAPQAIEQKTHGILHQVVACSFEKALSTAAR